jgi:phosphatidylglycerophosphate synthase
VAVVPGDTLVDEAGVRRAPRCPVEAFPRLLAALLAGRTPSEALEGAGVAAAPLWGDGLWVPSESAASPRDLETALLTHLGRRTAAGDSYLAALVDRRAARPLTRLVLPWTRITPSHVTLLAIAAGVTGAAGLATTSYVSRLGGAVLLVVSIWLDCVDGEVARARYEQSPAGARLDVLGDYLVHLAVFGALAFGLVRQRAGAAAAWAGAGLLGGVVTAMALLHLLFIRPALSRGGDIHWAGDGDTLRGTPVATVAEKLASRDYTYLLLACALADRLPWFVYATAVGSWLFVTALIGWWWSVWRRAGRREAVVS